MKKLTLMRTFSIVLIISIILSCNVLAVDTAPEIDETVLLQASQEIINAQVKYYDIENVAVVDPTYVSANDNGYYVDYILELTMKLKYDNATELPQIRGLAEAFNIDSTVLTTQEFSQKMQSSEVFENTALAASAEAAELAYSLNDSEIAILASTFSDSVATVAQSEFAASQKCTIIVDDMSFLDVATMQPADKELIVAAAIADLATTDVVNFVEEVETDNIGISQVLNYYLRAEFDNNNTFLGLEYGIADGFTDDISYIIPRPEKEMILLGEQQAVDAVTSAAQTISRAFSADEFNRANTTFTYKKISARNYANTYTSAATSHSCTGSLEGHKSSYANVKQNQAKYNKAYNYYCGLDCANYASQVMAAGGVPTSTTWKSGSVAWINGTEMKRYFYTNNNMWSKTNFTNAAAGEFIQMLNSSGRSMHTMIIVLNDTVNRAYSAHTSDRLKLPYSGDATFTATDWCVAVEYYRFANYSMT